MSTEREKEGANSVAVIGAGFAGTRAALDLAEVGVKVYLVDQKNSPGGTLTDLERMFPGHDCGACKALPAGLATGCQRQFSNVPDHPNIVFIGGTSFESLAGERGDFKIGLRRSPNHIAVETCTGCGECVELCPVDKPLDGAGRAAIKRDFSEECMPLKIEKGTAYPCRDSCTIGINVPGFVQLVKTGRFLEAWKLMYDANPFPSLCGYRCQQSCTLACSGKGGEPVDVAALARFVTRYVYEHHAMDLPLPEVQPSRREKVAIIGSGPAGLTAAYQLTRMGYSVTVFESSGQAGGLLRQKAPSGLGKLLDMEISLLRQLGVEVLTGVSLGASLPVENLLYCGYQAVLIATVARITSIARIWQKVSSGGRMPSSYQVTISEKEKTPLLALVEKPSIYNFDLPGIFTIRSLAFGSVHGDIALMAGQMAAGCIDTYLATTFTRRKESREGVTGREQLHQKSAGRLAPVPTGEDRDPEEKGFTPAEAVLEAGRCLNCGGGCVDCGLCLEVCPTASIDLRGEAKALELKVGAVLLAQGPDFFDPSALDSYGYGVYPNVITAREMEHRLSAARREGTVLARSSDQATPLKVAWIQCAGSRNKRYLEYCSSICCQVAFKEARLVKKMSSAIETVIFGMDQRPFGADGEKQVQEALESGVRFERTRIYSLQETAGKNILIRYAREDGSLREEEFSLVVLSTGLKPKKLADDSSAPALIDTDPYGFARTSFYAPCETTCKGVLSAGVLNGPKDIASSVIDARAAAMGALESLSIEVLTPEKAIKSFDPEDSPRLGVFVCACGGSIGRVVSPAELAHRAKRLPLVRYAAEVDFACLPEGLDRMKRLVKKYELNRVVLAACTPRLREKEMVKALGEVDILPAQLERVNIREQVAWVHQDDQKGATEKAVDLLRAGIRKVRMAEGGPAAPAIVEDALVVVGGTVGGMSAALTAAGRGVRVHLVVLENSLEESAAAMAEYSPSTDWREYTARLAGEVREQGLIQTLEASRIVSVDGAPGRFQTRVATPSGHMNIIHGAVILAGGTRFWRQGRLWANKAVVKSQAEFSQILTQEGLGTSKSLVFLPPQLPGLNEFKNYSRAGCITALQNAVKAKHDRPDLSVFFLYRDLLVYGKDEALYEEARRSGVLFIRFDSGNPPIVTESPGGLQVEVLEPVLGRPLLIDPDLIVMEAYVRPDFYNATLAGLYGTGLRENGYIPAANDKFLPLDSNAPGVYLCGLARGLVAPAEEIIQGKASAMGALTFLIKERPALHPHVATVTEKWCNGCGLCLSACPAGARTLDPETRVVKVDQTRCLGCGACQAACRSAATRQVNLSKKHVLEVIDELL